MFKNKFKKLTSIFLVMVLAFSVTPQAYAMDIIIKGLCELAIGSCAGGGCTGCCTNCCCDEEEIEKADIYLEEYYTDNFHYRFNKKTGHLIIGKDIETKRLKDIVDIPSNELDVIRTVTIGNGVTKICKKAFQFFDNATDEGYFKNSLTNITIPNSVTSIGACAFYGCFKLKEITIPSSVTTIGGEAFHRCGSLESINVNEENPNYKSIDGILFSKDGTKLCRYPQGKGNCTNIYTIPIGVKKIGSGAFRGCGSLTYVNIPSSVTTIGESAFECCTSLTSVTIPEGVKGIGNRTFAECNNLREITIPNSVTEIGNMTFADCGNLGEITIPNSVTEIGERAFSRCKRLKSITIPKGVRKIRNETFSCCESLEKVSIPDSVNEIGRYAFYRCVCLRKVFIPYPKFVSTHESSFGSCCSHLRIIDRTAKEKEENSSDPM